MTKQMLKPWGFVPRDGKDISNAQLEEEYTTVRPPLYSTLPDSADIEPVKGYKALRMASRTNQRIIMLNNGNGNQGFTVCKDCGAAMPGDKSDVLKNIERPYKIKYGRQKCRHYETINVNLGYDFVTDMLVLEFKIDPSLVETNTFNFVWLRMAPQSLAEAIRLAACKELDIEFTELVTGYRIRRNVSNVFVDVYLYDSLSSGAGYAIRASEIINELLEKTYDLLEECDCGSSCYKCLKHYRNQYAHGSLDRHSALDLLNWSKKEKVKSDPPFCEQAQLIKPLIGILKMSDCEILITDSEIFAIMQGIKKKLVVYPGMRVLPNDKNCVYVSDGHLKFAKPYAVEQICNSFK